MTDRQYHYTTADARHLLAAAFDDPGLDAFVQDRYPAVFGTFSRGMRTDEKITLLLGHCRRQEDLDLLATAVQARAPWTYTPPSPPAPGELPEPGF